MDDARAAKNDARAAKNDAKKSSEGIPPVLRNPPIAEELDKLRELPPRTTNREPLSRLERLAILNGLRGGLSTSRIATQWSMSVKTRPTLEGQDIRRTLEFL